MVSKSAMSRRGRRLEAVLARGGQLDVASLLEVKGQLVSGALPGALVVQQVGVGLERHDLAGAVIGDVDVEHRLEAPAVP